LLAGLGNSVFHPADYSILNASVDPRRIGRGYSVHAISGNLGYAVAPGAVVGLTAQFGWRAALVGVGLAGLAVVLVLAAQRGAFGVLGPTPRAHRSVVGDVRMLLTAPILAAFAYFALIATAVIGVQIFGVTTLMRVYDTALAQATAALTAVLLRGAAGLLARGLLADRVRRHDVVAATGLLIAAGFMILLAAGAGAGGALAPVLSRH